MADPKLSGKQVRQIRELYASGKCQDYELLSMAFGVSDITIRGVISGRTHYYTELFEEPLEPVVEAPFLDSWCSGNLGV